MTSHDIAHWVILLCAPVILAYSAIFVMGGIYQRMSCWDVSVRAWGGASVFVGYVVYTNSLPMMPISMALITFGIFLFALPGVWELVKVWHDLEEHRRPR